MKILVNSLLLVLLCVVTGFAQKVEVRDFKGLDTRSSDFTIQPNFARMAHNIDFSRGGVGAISQRAGWSFVDTLLGMDSIIGIYGAYYSDGTQQLIVVADSAGVGYGGIYATQKGSANLDSDSLTKVSGFWSAQQTPYFAMHNNNVFIVNGAQKGRAWNGEISRGFPVRVSGEPVIVPIDLDGAVDSDTISGEYRYTFKQRAVAFPRQRFWITIDTVLNSNAYNDTITTNGGANRVVTFTSDATATASEIVVGLITEINGTAGLSDSVNAQANSQDKLLGRYSILETVDATNLTIKFDTAIPIEQSIESTVGSGSIDSFTIGFGIVSSPVSVNGGRILLTGFNAPEYDTSFGSIDTLVTFIYRSKKNPGPLTPNDSMGFIDSFIVIDSSGGNNGIDAISDVVVIDSIRSDTLTMSGVLRQHLRIGRFSTGAYVRRMGAPGFVFSDTLLDSNTTTTQYFRGIYRGWPALQRDTVGVLYTITFIDTITGYESDTGRSLFVSYKSNSDADVNRAYTISLPKIPSNETGLVVNIYRAAVMQVTRDTVFHYIDTTKITVYEEVIPADVGGDDNVGGGGGNQWDEIYNENNPISHEELVIRNRALYGRAVDSTIVSTFYLVSQVPSSQATFRDSIAHDSLALSAPIYTKHSPPDGLKNLISTDNRLFGTVGSDLYFSRLDKVTSWSAFSGISLNRDDGDENTTVYPLRGLVRVLKNKSSFNVFQDANLNWNRQEVSGAYGSIASHSHARGFNKNYFLSDIGVIAESEGQFLNRTQSIELVSARLDNFDKIPISTKARARAFYDDQKYMLSIGDTTYVYDERAQAWSTWDFSFLDATHYGVETNVGFFPGDTMYFIKPGQAGLYRFSDAEIDSSINDIDVEYRSAPFLVGSQQDGSEIKNVNSIGLWTRSYATTTAPGITGTLIKSKGGINDTTGSFVGGTAFLNETQRFFKYSIDADVDHFFSLKLQKPIAGGLDLIGIAIDGYDIYWVPMGSETIK